jgi:hypothetical protein
VIEVDGVEWGRPDELAPQFAHVTARNVYDWIRDGIIPAGQVRRVGRAMWTTWDAVDRAVDADLEPRSPPDRWPRPGRK